ncbi:uncharacterized protein LOC126899913 isoform X2 [Daktulosphaira vitifoliae]|nr:uncharacterized protein LOC126899913 isoform X2 [Daktulosphaira vitifoliae]XP_050531137.1 uncharacterized protein LOC126899913 isoform X2 [Daktulosphaira vitifoliae]
MSLNEINEKNWLNTTLLDQGYKIFGTTSTVEIIQSSIFMAYCWNLSNAYTDYIMDPLESDTRSRKFWWLKKTLSTILFMTGGEFWKNGFLLNLNLYTLPLLSLINNNLNTTFKIDEALLENLETPCKIIITSFVLLIMHLWYNFSLDKFHEESMRLRDEQIMRVDNWNRFVNREPYNELGNTGYLLLRNTRNIHHNMSINYDSSTRLKQIQSCPILCKKKPLTIKLRKRSKSI